jgi:hypothetical protein
LEDQDDLGGGSSRWTRWFGLVPLLPAIGLIIIVAIVATALSTRIVSLNFTGAAPTNGAVNGSELGGKPLATTAPTVAFTTSQTTPVRFTETVRISNGMSTGLRTWRMTLHFAADDVIRVRNARAIRLGNVVTVRATAPLRVGASVLVTLVARGTAADPTACVLDGKSCLIA